MRYRSAICENLTWYVGLLAPGYDELLPDLQIVGLFQIVAFVLDYGRNLNFVSGCNAAQGVVLYHRVVDTGHRKHNKLLSDGQQVRILLHAPIGPHDGLTANAKAFSDVIKRIPGLHGIDDNLGTNPFWNGRPRHCCPCQVILAPERLRSIVLTTLQRDLIGTEGTGLNWLFPGPSDLPPHHNQGNEQDYSSMRSPSREEWQIIAQGQRPLPH
ncbi:MAG: hypothetical protein L6435_05195 [Anaerolineae bacterium]|nr:hypothetical protein [Anaerolineae bacterium]